MGDVDFFMLFVLYLMIFTLTKYILKNDNPALFSRHLINIFKEIDRFGRVDFT